MVYIPKGNYLTNLVHGESKMHWLVKALMDFFISFLFILRKLLDLKEKNCKF